MLGLLIFACMLFLISIYLYNDGIGCYLIFDKTDCGRNQLCSWTDTGICVAKKYNVETPGWIPCEGIKSESACYTHNKGECIWNIPKSRCIKK